MSLDLNVAQYFPTWYPTPGRKSVYLKWNSITPVLYFPWARQIQINWCVSLGVGVHIHDNKELCKYSERQLSYIDTYRQITNIYNSHSNDFHVKYMYNYTYIRLQLFMCSQRAVNNLWRTRIQCKLLISSLSITLIEYSSDRVHYATLHSLKEIVLSILI